MVDFLNMCFRHYVLFIGILLVILLLSFADFFVKKKKRERKKKKEKRKKKRKKTGQLENTNEGNTVGNYFQKLFIL